MAKRTLSIALALVLALGLFIPAIAAETEAVNPYAPVITQQPSEHIRAGDIIVLEAWAELPQGVEGELEFIWYAYNHEFSHRQQVGSGARIEVDTSIFEITISEAVDIFGDDLNFPAHLLALFAGDLYTIIFGWYRFEVEIIHVHNDERSAVASLSTDPIHINMSFRQAFSSFWQLGPAAMAVFFGENWLSRAMGTVASALLSPFSLLASFLFIINSPIEPPNLSA